MTIVFAYMKRLAIAIFFSSFSLFGQSMAFAVMTTQPNIFPTGINQATKSTSFPPTDSGTLPIDNADATKYMSKAPNTSSAISEPKAPFAWYDMITNVPMDAWLFAKQDVWNPGNVSHFLGIGSLTGVLLTMDDETWQQSNKWYSSNKWITRSSIFFKEFGDGRTQFGLAAGFALYGWLGRDSRALRTGSQIVEVVLGSGGVVQVLKHMTGRESPFVSTAPGGKWRFLPNQIDYHKHVPAFDAMPSGHICTSVATFVLICENYPECKSWMVPMSCLLTAGIGVGMVNTGIHWYSDYPLGVAIGYAFGELVSHREQRLLEEKEGAKLVDYSITPYITALESGLTLNVTF